MPIQTALSFLRWLNIFCIIAYMQLWIKASAPVNIILILVAAAVVVGAMRMTRATLALRREVREQEERAKALGERKEELLRRLEERDAPETVEYQAKATMNLKNSGEEVVVVVPDAPSGTSATPATFWRRVKDFFAKIF